jgi:hypothetical protein
MIKLPTFDELARYVVLDGPLAMAREKYLEEWLEKGSPFNAAEREQASKAYAEVLLANPKMVALELGLLALSLNGALVEKGLSEDDE